MYTIYSPEETGKNIAHLSVRISGHIQRFTVHELGEKLLIYIGDIREGEIPIYEYSLTNHNQESQYDFHFSQVVQAYLKRPCQK